MGSGQQVALIEDGSTALTLYTLFEKFRNVVVLEKLSMWGNIERLRGRLTFTEAELKLGPRLEFPTAASTTVPTLAHSTSTEVSNTLNHLQQLADTEQQHRFGTRTHDESPKVPALRLGKRWPSISAVGWIYLTTIWHQFFEVHADGSRLSASFGHMPPLLSSPAEHNGRPQRLDAA
jgi:hypothetical protein